jgi:hypothetical protein
MNDELGRLEPVDLRTVWLSEPRGFTPWVARDDNLALLGHAIGIDLELVAQEHAVGPFRADILCKRADDLSESAEEQSFILIENQLERTDHLHLGQLLTYAAGLKAAIVVWVAASFTEEHRAALDWLNRITTDQFRFFGLEVELWRIGSSPAAPRFNIVAKPNDWSRTVSQAARTIESGAVRERAARYLPYWAALQRLLAARQSPVQLTNPRAEHAVHFAIGRTGFRLAAFAGWRDKLIGVGIYIKDLPGKPYFHLLERQRSAIETELGFPVEWQELPEQRRSRIEVTKQEVDPADKTDWPAQHTWLAERLESFARTFRQRVITLNVEDWSAESEPQETTFREAL